VAQRNDDRLEEERRSKSVGSATGEWAFTWENTLRSADQGEQELAKLKKLDGAAFDREYVREMIAGHQEALDRVKVHLGIRKAGDCISEGVDRLGVRPMPADHHTIAGRIPGLANGWMLATHSGITLGPLLGRLMAEEIVRGAPQSMLAPFRPERFLAAPTVLGVADTSGIELIHPWRDGWTANQIGKKGQSNQRWNVGGSCQRIGPSFVLRRSGSIRS